MLCPFKKDATSDKSREESHNYWNEDIHFNELEKVGHITKIRDTNKKEIFELKLLEVKEVRPNIFQRKI